MSFEIERKFLVQSSDWRHSVVKKTHIRQAYLATTGKASVRVRIKDDVAATLTIKSRGSDLRRLELEYEVPVLEAMALLGLRQGSVIEKVRHVIPTGDLAWEVDEFSGENAGLVIAEIELRHEHQGFTKPSWVGVEVTRQAAYYNSALSVSPFAAWHAKSKPGSISAA